MLKLETWNLLSEKVFNNSELIRAVPRKGDFQVLFLPLPIRCWTQIQAMSLLGAGRNIHLCLKLLCFVYRNWGPWKERRNTGSDGFSESAWWDAGWGFVFWSCARNNASNGSQVWKHNNVCMWGLEICCPSCLFKLPNIERVPSSQRVPFERTLERNLSSLQWI